MHVKTVHTKISDAALAVHMPYMAIYKLGKLHLHGVYAGKLFMTVLAMDIQDLQRGIYGYAKQSKIEIIEESGVPVDTRIYRIRLVPDND